MSPQKRRKSLDDSLAAEFVYGALEVEKPATEPEPLPASQEETATEAETEVKAKPIAPAPKQTRKKEKPSIMDKLMQAEKEPTVRITVDLNQSMHRKLSLLSARTGRKKADIVRMLLDEALEDVEE